jgi:Zn-dependent peptidase ImmA (M78 family)
MLSQETIERRAWKLLVKAGVKKPGFNVEKLATYLGATITEVEAEDDISGAIVREGNSINIGVNAKHHANRRRFTIAHEIGHLVLHDAEAQVDHGYGHTTHRGPRLAAFRDRVSSEATNPREIEANRYAAALLMPVQFLEKSIKKQPMPLREKEVQKLASEYDVSTQAMTYRLTNVGISVDLAG